MTWSATHRCRALLREASIGLLDVDNPATLPAFSDNPATLPAFSGRRGE